MTIGKSVTFPPDLGRGPSTRSALPLRSHGGTFLLGFEFSVQCGLCKQSGGHAVETHYEGRGTLRSKGKRIT